MVLNGEYIRYDNYNKKIDINTYINDELISRELYDKDGNLIYYYYKNIETNYTHEIVDHPLIKLTKINNKYEGKFIINTYENNKMININSNIYIILLEKRESTILNIQQYIECTYKEGKIDGIYLEYNNKKLIMKSEYKKGIIINCNKYRDNNLITQKEYDFNTKELIKFKIYNKHNNCVYKMIKQNNNKYEHVDIQLLKATLLNDKFIGKYQEYVGKLNNEIVYFYDDTYINLSNQVLKHLNKNYTNLKPSPNNFYILKNYF